MRLIHRARHRLASLTPKPLANMPGAAIAKRQYRNYNNSSRPSKTNVGETSKLLDTLIAITLGNAWQDPRLLLSKSHGRKHLRGTLHCAATSTTDAMLLLAKMGQAIFGQKTQEREDVLSHKMERVHFVDMP